MLAHSKIKNKIGYFIKEIRKFCMIKKIRHFKDFTYGLQNDNRTRVNNIGFLL